VARYPIRGGGDASERAHAPGVGLRVADAPPDGLLTGAVLAVDPSGGRTRRLPPIVPGRFFCGDGFAARAALSEAAASLASSSAFPDGASSFAFITEGKVSLAGPPRRADAVEEKVGKPPSVL
jgi:hypothetical protein